MTPSLQLALLNLSLGAARVQASTHAVGGNPMPELICAPTGVMTLQMTSVFGDAFSGGTLRTAVYESNRFGPAIYYQITNNAGSTDAIRGISSKAFEGTDGLNPTTANHLDGWNAQVKDGFGSFVQGTSKAVGEWGAMLVGYDGGGFAHTTTLLTQYFTQNAEIDKPKSNGIAPGESSYIGVTWANDGKVGTGIAYGTVDIDGWKVATIVRTEPEPEEYALMLAGLGMVGKIVGRRKSKQDVVVMNSEFAAATL
jgi:hypothetical protein